MTDTLALELMNISSEELHTRTVNVARKEQQTTLELLSHLHEVERRKLFADLGFSSLWEYSMKALGYSEAQTAERVSAMRFMFRTEETKKAIEKGSLNLTQAAQTERHLRAEEKEAREKVSSETLKGLLSEVSGKSTRETEKVLLSYRPREEKPERIQAVRADLSEVRFSVSETTRVKIERYWELQGRESLSDLFTKVLSFYLDRKDPEKKAIREEGKRFRDPLSPENVSPPHKGFQNKELQASPPWAPKVTAEYTPAGEKEPAAEIGQAREMEPPVEGKRSRYVGTKTRREVRKRSGGRCEYVDPDTQRRCESRYRLEFDHIHPHALGGTSDVGNMRMLCRTHNQYLGEQFFSKNSRLFRIRLTG